MLRKSKFNIGDTVYITLEAFNNTVKMKASIPFKYFELNKPYKVKDIGRSINVNFKEKYNEKLVYMILVEESEQYLNEDYFSKEPITIDLNKAESNITNEETFLFECEQKANQFTDESLKFIIIR